MQMMSDAELLIAIKAFLKQHKMKKTHFGMQVMRDRALLWQLEKGRSLSLSNANHVVNWMCEYEEAAGRLVAA